MPLLSGKVWWAVQISSFWRNWGILQTSIDRSNEFENELKVFSNSELNVTNRWGHLCSFHVPFLSYDPEIVGKSAFFNFVLILAKRSTYVKAIYIYASETSCYVLSGNVIIYLMNGGSGPYKPYHFLKDCKKIFRSIYVNCFNILRFLAEVSTKLQKMHFFGQFKDCNSWRKHGN